jgi:rod shape-determining protein MreD
VVRRVVSITLIVVTALVLQSTVFWDLKLLGVQPELLYAVVILLAFLEGPAEGAVVGFACGLAIDFMLDQPKGITALTLTLLGYSIGMLRTYIVSPSPLLPAMLVAVGTAVAIGFYVVVSFLLGQFDETPLYAVKVALLTGLYGGILTPLLYPLMRRISEGSRPKRVVRF